MKNVLVFMNSFNVGGVTNVAMAIYNRMDKSKFKMDFIRDGIFPENEIDKQVKANGDNVYLFTKPALNKIPVINYEIQKRAVIKELLRQIGDKKYDAIHIHAHAQIALPLAKKLKIPVKITHFHEGRPDFGDNADKSIVTSYLWKKRQKLYNKVSTVKCGDSLNACKIKYGKKAKVSEFTVLNPPIDFDKFNPNNYSLEKIYNEFNVDKSAFNMIHVGRVSYIKNQKFMIDILAEINKTKKCNLYIVGEGDYKKELIAHAKKRQVEQNLIFLPANTTPGLYLAMDCSLLTSFSEAFGMVAVESQVMGVRCFASTFVPTEVAVGGCIFLDLSLGEKVWAKAILDTEKGFVLQKEKIDNFKIENLVGRLEKIYDGIK